MSEPRVLTHSAPPFDVEADSLCHCLVLSQKCTETVQATQASIGAGKEKIEESMQAQGCRGSEKLFLDLFQWRKSGTDSESAEFVCPERVLTSICRRSSRDKEGRRAPESMEELRKAWSPLPLLLRKGDEGISESFFAVTRNWNLHDL